MFWLAGRLAAVLAVGVSLTRMARRGRGVFIFVFRQGVEG